MDPRADAARRVTPPELVLLAAGLSTRYGRAKATDPVGPGGAPLMAYTIVDALRGGFGRVAVVTRPGIEGAIRECLARTVGDAVPLRVVHQRVAAGSARPRGTGEAVIRAAPTGPFAVANADDWYGPEGIRAVGTALTADPEQAVLVGYPAGRTLSERGGVSRGEIVSRNEWVSGVREILDLARDTDGRLRGRDEAGELVTLADDAPVSMNLWGFPPWVVPALDRRFATFLAADGAEPDTEFRLSSAIGALVASGELSLRLLHAGERWFGMTFPGDREDVVGRLAALHADGTYPTPLSSAL